MIILIILSSLIVLFVLTIYVSQKYLNSENKEFCILTNYIHEDQVERIRLRSIRDKNLEEGEVMYEYGFYFYNYNDNNKLETLFKLYFTYLLDKKTNVEISNLNDYLQANKDNLYLQILSEYRIHLIKYKKLEENFYLKYKDIYVLYIITMLFSRGQITSTLRRFYKIK